MSKQTWESYWAQRERGLLERQIQAYKSRIGYARLLAALPEIGEKGIVLEVGAGKAFISGHLRSRGWHTVAIDKNQYIARIGASSVENYIVGDMFTLPFSEGSFDLVASCGLLEHFDLQVVRQIVQEMTRIGRSVVAWLPTCGLEWRIFWRMRNMLGGDVYTLSHKHAKEELIEIFRSAGLSVKRFGYVRFAGILRYAFIYGRSET